MRTFTMTASAVLLALTACGDAEDPAVDTAETPQPDSVADAEPMPDAGAPPGPEGDDGTLGSDAVAQGSWSAKTERGVAMALYGPPQTEADLVVRCEGDNLVFIRGAPVDGEGEMELRAGGETRTVTARTRPGPIAQTAGELPADDPFAATLASTTRPIALRVDGGPFYRVPSHEHLRELVRNCRG